MTIFELLELALTAVLSIGFAVGAAYFILQAIISLYQAFMVTRTPVRPIGELSGELGKKVAIVGIVNSSAPRSDPEEHVFRSLRSIREYEDAPILDFYHPAIPSEVTLDVHYSVAFTLTDSSGSIFVDGPSIDAKLVSDPAISEQKAAFGHRRFEESKIETTTRIYAFGKVTEGRGKLVLTAPIQGWVPIIATTFQRAELISKLLKSAGKDLFYGGFLVVLLCGLLYMISRIV